MLKPNFAKESIMNKKPPYNITRRKKPSSLLPVITLTIIMVVLIIKSIDFGTTSKQKAAHDIVQHEYYSDITTAGLNNILSNSETTKVVMIFATWCPACRRDMPQFANMRLPAGTEKIAISLDHNTNKLENYIRQYSNSDIQWYRLPFTCENYYCKEIKRNLNNAGINYYGGVPHFSIHYANGSSKQDLLMCEISGSCKGAVRKFR